MKKWMLPLLVIAVTLTGCHRDLPEPETEIKKEIEIIE